MSNPDEGAEVPDDVPTIKEHLRIRREAMSMLSADIAILLHALQGKLGTVEYLKYLTEVAAEDAAVKAVYEQTKTS